jgi:transposase-like protein
LPEAIAAVFSPTILRTCIVHLIRNSMDFASWKDRKPIRRRTQSDLRATDADVAAAPPNPTSPINNNSQSRNIIVNNHVIFYIVG